MNFTLSHPQFYSLGHSLKVANYGMREKAIFCIHGFPASAYHIISKEIEDHIFRHNRIFRHKYMYNQPKLTK